MLLHGPSISLRSLHAAHRHGFLPSRDSLYALLLQTSALEDGGLLPCRQAHSIMACFGFDAIPALGDHLVRSFARNGSLFEASLAFCKVADPTAHTWNAILSSHAKNGGFAMAVRLFDAMREEGEARPNKHIFSCLFKAFGGLGAQREGQLLHTQMVRSGHDLDEYIGSSVIDMYSNCGCLAEASNVLDALRSRDVVSWNALMVGYIRHGHHILALELYEKMNDASIPPTKVTLSSILKACGGIGAIQEGLCVHDFIVRSQLEMDEIIAGAVVNMYSKCGKLSEAMLSLDRCSRIKTRVNWNALLVGCVQHDSGKLAFELYENMQEQGIAPDHISLGCVLRACRHHGTLAQGRVLHNAIVQNGFSSHIFIGSALIELYVHYGALGEAQRVFYELPDPSMCSWCALVKGYSLHGHSQAALEISKEMVAMGLEVDKQAFLCMIQACGDGGALHHGRLLHCHTAQCCLDLDIDVGSSLISMYADCGDFATSHEVLERLPGSDFVSWSALICAYVEQGFFVPALQTYEKFLRSGVSTIVDEVMCSYLVKACAEVGAACQCNQVLSRIFESGFDQSATVSISLLELYIKHGRFEEAYNTLISGRGSTLLAAWNAAIAGCIEHGNSILARRCFEAMRSRGVRPDERTFTSALSACCRGGERDYGIEVFKAMEAEYGITPGIEHVNCVVDLLGRGGLLDEAEALIRRTPHSPDIVGWRSLLSSSSKFGNSILGRDCQTEICHSRV